MQSISKTATVTGATGFLGYALVCRLLNDGWRVIATGRDPGTGMVLQQLGVEFHQADLSDRAAIFKIIREGSVVFHCGAKSSPWGPPLDFHRSNVVGTGNVTEACRAAGIARLVHVSTPSVYFDFQDARDISEEAPTPGRANSYTRTKLEAERIVDSSGVPAVTLRPRAIFGPGDRVLFPRLIRAHGSKGLPLIGPEDPLMDVTFVDNVVDALLLAANAPAGLVGRKFNISNGEPWRRSDLFRTALECAGLAPKFRVIPRWAAMGMATGMECGSVIFSGGRREPVLTRYTVGALSTTQTLDISAARRFLGYEPRVTVAEGLRRFGEWWKERNGG